MIASPPAFWSLSAADLLQQLQTTTQGLTGDQAQGRLRLCGANRLQAHMRSDAATLLVVLL
jgi:hypothetical protein